MNRSGLWIDLDFVSIRTDDRSGSIRTLDWSGLLNIKILIVLIGSDWSWSVLIAIRTTTPRYTSSVPSLNMICNLSIFVMYQSRNEKNIDESFHDTIGKIKLSFARKCQNHCLVVCLFLLVLAQEQCGSSLKLLLLGFNWKHKPLFKKTVIPPVWSMIQEKDCCFLTLFLKVLPTLNYLDHLKA